MTGGARFGRVDAVCLGAVLWAAGASAVSPMAGVAHWDLNPLLVEAPESAMTPGQMLVLSGLAVLASAVLWARSGAGRSALAWCWLVGGAGVLLHGLVLTPLTGGVGADAPRGDLRGLVMGASWMAGLVSGWAIATHRERALVLRLVVGTVLTLCAVLAAKGLFERFVEYPGMIAAYRDDPVSAQLSQGIEPGSRRAELYERRLLNGRPTGWFGLSNVLASFMGAGLVLCVGLAIGMRDLKADKALGGGVRGLPVVLGLMVGAVLLMTGSAAGIGLGVVVSAGLAVFLLSGRVRARLGARAWAMVLAPAVGVLGLVVVRGTLLVESLERSVLFRWHYWVGTVRVFAENWLLGAGPTGFQAAYTRLKLAVSPENVQTPHALPADWLGVLGVLGLVWLVALVVWIVRRRPLEEGDEGCPEGWCGAGVQVLFVGGVTGAAVVSAGIVQWPVWVIAPDLVLVLLIGWAIGLGVVWAIGRCGEGLGRGLGIGVVGAAAMLLGHAMFDVTPSWPTSAMLFWVVLGVGLPVGLARPGLGGARAMAGAGVLALQGGVVLVAGLVQSTRVEPLLASAARGAATARQATGPEDLEARLLEAERGLRLAMERSVPDSLEIEMAYLQFRGSVEPVLGPAIAEGRVGDADPIDVIGAAMAGRWEGSVSAQGRLATVLGRMGAGSAEREFGVRAAVRAAELSPHDAGPAYRAFELLDALGRPEEARRWGRRALENHGQAEMDELAGLTESQLLRLRGLFSDGDGVGGGGTGGD